MLYAWMYSTRKQSRGIVRKPSDRLRKQKVVIVFSCQLVACFLFSGDEDEHLWFMGLSTADQSCALNVHYLIIYLAFPYLFFDKCETHLKLA